MYPFSFQFDVVIALLPGDRLEFRFEMTNTGKASLPWYAGHHFYFAVPHLERGRLDARPPLRRVGPSALRRLDRAREGGNTAPVSRRPVDHRPVPDRADGGQDHAPQLEERPANGDRPGPRGRNGPVVCGDDLDRISRVRFLLRRAVARPAQRDPSRPGTPPPASGQTETAVCVLDASKW